MADPNTQLPPDLMKLAEGFMTSLSSLQESLNAVNTKLGGISLPQAPTPKEEEEPSINFDVSQLESMPRAELVRMLMDAVDQKVNYASRQFSGRLEDVSRDLRTYSATNDVKETAGKYKDFWEWKQELQDTAVRHPTLNAQQLYNMVRAENPTKAKELDAKFNPPVEEPPAKKSSGFGGFFPSSSIAKTDESKGKMTATEAATAAWEAAMGDDSIASALKSSEGT